jgi:hypothetical protein
MPLPGMIEKEKSTHKKVQAFASDNHLEKDFASSLSSY